ncbi:MAG: sialidase family protein [Planctomycetota bacterium]
MREKEETDARRLVVAVGVGNGTVTWFSDDDGITWKGPSNLCVSPPVKGRWVDPGNAGHLVELKDGRLWMLLRNSQDHFWEYFSDDHGASWSKGQPSRFVGVFSNVRLHRIPDGRLILVWLNNMPRSGLRDFHKTGRDVVHAAISDDDGKTWRGFREVVLGRQRHSLVFSRVRAYDVGIHHQKVTVTKDNKALVFTGQDEKFTTRDSAHRQAVIFDLDWLYETSRSTDFSSGYDDLCVFKFSRKPWGNTPDYSRVLGATLIEHPTEPYKKVLHLGRENCDWVFNEQDGANWNFPIGKSGTLETRILLRKGFKGGSISLVDVFYPPSDNAGDQAAMYRFEIPQDGRIGTSTVLQADTWYDVKLQWTGTEDKAAHECRVSINGTLLPERLPLKNASRNGICYVRFRSTAPDEDLAGWLVESIKANITAHNSRHAITFDGNTVDGESFAPIRQ